MNRKRFLGWIMDTICHHLTLLGSQLSNVHSALVHFPSNLRHASHWCCNRIVGIIHSISMSLPGGGVLLSHLQWDLYQ